MSRALTMALGLTLVMSLAAAPVPAEDDTELIGPSTFWQDPSGNGCTLGFILERYVPSSDGSDRPTGDLYALTAAHCFEDARAGEPTIWEPGTGPGVIVREETVGHALYAFRQPNFTEDVALVDLTVADDRVTPAVCYWGGPTELRATRPEGGDTLLLSGAGSNLRPRQVIASERQDEAVRYDGPQLNGDSGGPVLDEAGRALGIVSFGGVDFRASKLSTEGATPVAEALEHVRAATNLDLRLVTAPRAERDYPRDVSDVPCAVKNPLAVP